jgi:hypothetical protein
MSITKQRADLKSTAANTGQPSNDIDVIVAVMENKEFQT